MFKIDITLVLVVNMKDKKILLILIQKISKISPNLIEKKYHFWTKLVAR